MVDQKLVSFAEDVPRLLTELRDRHDPIHHVESTIRSPRSELRLSMLDEGELRVRLRAGLTEIVRNTDGTHAVEVANTLKGFDIEKVHLGIGASEWSAAYSHLVTSPREMLFRNNLVIAFGVINHAPMEEKMVEYVYEPTEDNKAEALKLVGLLLRAVER